MKKQKLITSFVGRVCGLALALTLSPALLAQNAYTAWNVSSVGTGNEETKDYGIRNDFQVLQPITITKLGMFDSGGDGVQGSGAITIQLYQLSGAKASLLLETKTFDAANPGSLSGGYRYKALDRPVTLLPGHYTLTANGFDAPNFEYNATVTSDNPAVQVSANTGSGLIQFLGCNRFHNGDPLQRSKQEKNIGPANRFAAGTFIYSAATLPAVPYATDYAALSAGVGNFPSDTGKTNIHDGVNVGDHYGSIAVLTDGAFPVVVEPGGTRLVLEAAGTYNGDSNGARCVLFAHEQWGYAFNDSRGTLFENAIKWASRKSNPADIVVGLSTNLDAAYFASRGYQVRVLNWGMQSVDQNPMLGCDVVVANFHGPYSDEFLSRLSDFTANGGGLVSTFLPWRYIHGTVRPMFARVNVLLQPFGLTYRSSLTQPVDFGFTNIQVVPYPVYFSAFPAAEMLRGDRLGQIQLDSLAKATAMHTIMYGSDGQPDLLAALVAAYSGTTNNGTESVSGVSSFVDVATLSGSQTTSNLLGQWQVEANGDLTAQGRRGSVEYQFNVPAAEVYQLQITGVQNIHSIYTNFDLILSVDGIKLGHYNLQARYGFSGTVKCLTPYLSPGAHVLRVFWDNSKNATQLRLQGLEVQAGIGPDNNGNGTKDWVEVLVNSQSGLDRTNTAITSYVSPLCLEGRDPYPSLMQVNVVGADQNNTALTPQQEPNGRWYVNVPLANAGSATLNVSYQNGAKSEARQLQWLPVNLFDGTNYTIRKGDSLVLVARPSATAKGTVQFTIGTNQIPSRNISQQMAYRFNDTGAITVTGLYTSPQGQTQSPSITVNVIGKTFTNNPDCWVGQERDWDLPAVPSQATFESDARLFTETIAALPGNGERVGLIIDQNESRYILSRLGTNGPVLDSTAARGFKLWSSADTYTQVLQTYADGSQSVEMLLVLSPVLPDLTVRLDVIVGGVVFDDGTTTKTLMASDFDALGRAVVHFVRPASAKTSVCNSITVFQNGALVGRIK